MEHYLPEYRGQWLISESTPERQVVIKPSAPITVRQVLTHTSGLPAESRLEQGKIDTRFAPGLPELQHVVLGLRTGSQYLYGNPNINTAGRIIEVVSGLPYEEFLEQRLLGPLGMVDTTMRPSAQQLRRLAKAYRPNPDKTALQEIPIYSLTAPYDAAHRGQSAGGGFFSTAHDLARFGRMMLNGGTLDGRRYLSQRSHAQMTTKQTGALDANYGFCWLIDPETGSYSHGGAYCNDFIVDVRNQLVLISLVQHMGFGGPDGDAVRPTFKRVAVESYHFATLPLILPPEPQPRGSAQSRAKVPTRLIQASPGHRSLPKDRHGRWRRAGLARGRALRPPTGASPAPGNDLMGAPRSISACAAHGRRSRHCSSRPRRVSEGNWQEAAPAEAITSASPRRQHASVEPGSQRSMVASDAHAPSDGARRLIAPVRAGRRQRRVRCAGAGAIAAGPRGCRDRRRILDAAPGSPCQPDDARESRRSPLRSPWIRGAGAIDHASAGSHQM